ncbi:unnamed protein product [Urochloa humidicola]
MLLTTNHRPDAVAITRMVCCVLGELGKEVHGKAATPWPLSGVGSMEVGIYLNTNDVSKEPGSNKWLGCYFTQLRCIVPH